MIFLFTHCFKKKNVAIDLIAGNGLVPLQHCASEYTQQCPLRESEGVH